MRLKGLRLHGFKSFADRTELSFEDGITCIVGPNGCGKSNVVDAVKWVLGEQRPTALRGDEMQDVIFGGTTDRKPLGFAEVALRFDNADRGLAIDFAEVEVCRRLHRDGTSEYLLNRAPCRLRDLRELLMDTGSGPGALTFMEQGRIDQILKESREDRRFVFEEAAGISKYKARRKESLRRLERVEADLLRVSDVVAEKERLVRSLRVQAGRAERYQALVDEMRRKRLALAVHRYGSLVVEREAASSRVVELTEKEGAARAQVRDALAELRRVEEELETRRAAVTRTEQEIAALEAQSESAREKAAFAARLAAELDGKIRWYAGEIESSATRLSDLAKSRDEAAEQHERATAEREERKLAVAACEKAIETSRGESQARRAESQRLAERAYDVVSRVAQLTSLRGKLEAEERTLASQASRLSSRLDAIGAEARDLEQRLAAAERAAEEAAVRLADGTGRLASAEERTASLEEELAAARDRLSALDRDVSAARSRVDVLRTLEQRHEGVGEGPRSVLQRARRDAEELRGIHGVLAEMIETDAESTSLVESALGLYATALVVDSFPDAVRAAAFVEKNKLGRCVFLPLDGVLPVRPPVEGSLASRVRCEPRLRAIVDALLGETVEASDLAAARARRGSASDPGAAPVRVVIASGAVLEAAGAVCAGGSPGGAGILQRRTELRALVERLDIQVASLEAARAETASLSERLVASRREVVATRDEVRAAETATHRARTDAERAKADSGRTSAEADRARRDLAEVETRRKAAADESAGVARRAVLLEGERAEVDRARTDAARRLEEAEAGLHQAEEARVAARVDLASVVERCSSLETRTSAIEREIGELESDVAEAREELAACEKRRHEADEKGREAHAAQQAAQKRRDRCVEDLARRRHDAAESHTRLEDRRRIGESLESEAASVGEELHRYRLRENESRLRVEGLIDRIRDELGVDLHEAWTSRSAAAEPAAGSSGSPPAPVFAESEAGAPPAFDPSSVETEIADLKSKIDRMGAVNLEALAQLRAEEEEARRLSAQHEDLVKSRESLMAAIRTIDAESRSLFTTTFETIRGHFQETFRRLFGGGKADVFLEEGQDVLEAGIEIVARPPGKETRSIALLSGGERTMTAVALMFAIYLAKPSPFCLLDEVDAALDESNIDRFVAALAGFAVQSQFIIVTHNKRTMTAAGTIVGISMPEPGVSRKIAVRLEDVDDDGRLRKTA